MRGLADLPLVLTIEETADALRIGRSAAYDAAKRGDLPTIRVGRCLRVPRCRLAAMLGEPLNESSPAGGPGSTQMQATGGAVGDARPV